MTNDSAADDDPLTAQCDRFATDLCQERGLDFSRISESVRRDFEWFVLSEYLNPVVEAVKECPDIRFATDHARRIDVHRGTTARWWSMLHSSPSLGDDPPGGYPDLKTVILTLARFEIDVGSLFPDGRKTLANAWLFCVTRRGIHDFGLPMTAEFSLEHCLCLHYLIESKSWSDAEDRRLQGQELLEEGQQVGDEDKVRVAKEHLAKAASQRDAAAADVIGSIRLLCPGGQIETQSDIRNVVEMWFEPFVLVFGVLKGTWVDW